MIRGASGLSAVSRKRRLELYWSVFLLCSCSHIQAAHPDPQIENWIVAQDFAALFAHVQELRSQVLADETLDHEQRALRLSHLGNELYNDERIPLEQTAPLLDLVAEAGRRMETAAVSDTLAVDAMLKLAVTVIRDRKQFDDALKLGQRRIELLERCSCAAEVDVDLARVSQGKVLHKAGRFADGVALLQPRLPALRQALIDRHAELADAITLLAELHRSLGRLQRNVEMQIEAYGLLEKQMTSPIDDPKVATRLRRQWLSQTHNLAQAYIDLDQLRNAELLYRAMEAACGEEPCDNRTLFFHRLGLATIARRQLRLEEADRGLTELLADLDQFGDTGLAAHALVLDELGWLRRTQGKMREASGYFAASLDSFRAAGKSTPIPLVLRRLAETQAALGQREAAHASYREALRLREQLSGPDAPAMGVLLASYAEWLLESGQADPDPESTLDRAIELLSRDPLLIGYRADALALRARLDAQSERWSTATEWMERSLREVEYLRAVAGFDPIDRARVHSTRLDDYHLLIRWYHQSGQHEAAWRVFERARARSLLDDLAGNRGIGTRQQPSDPSEALLAAESKVVEARARLLVAAPAASADALRDYEQSYRSLQVARARSAGSEAAAIEFVALSTVAAELIHQGGLLLAYFESPLGRSLLVVRAGSAQIDLHPLPSYDSQMPLLELAERVRSYEQPFDRELANALAALRTALLPDELLDELRSASELLLIPSGVLHQIPVEALVLRAGEDAASTSFCLDALPPIRYAPSATTLSLLAQRDDGTAAGWLLVANPTLAGAAQKTGRSTLRYAEREVEFIRNRRSDATVLAGSAASEPAFRQAAPRADVIHLAAHGLVESQASGDVASILLAPGASPAERDEDGLLDLDEILRLRLNARLTVLSACESHFGRTIGGEGSFALSRAFLAAGSARVLGTLWPVQDYAITWVMERFHERLFGSADHTQTPVASLWESKREMRRQSGWEAPCYWSAWVIIGLR